MTGEGVEKKSPTWCFANWMVKVKQTISKTSKITPWPISKPQSRGTACKLDLIAILFAFSWITSSGWGGSIGGISQKMTKDDKWGYRNSPLDVIMKVIIISHLVKRSLDTVTGVGELFFIGSNEWPRLVMDFVGFPIVPWYVFKP